MNDSIAGIRPAVIYNCPSWCVSDHTENLANNLANPLYGPDSYTRDHMAEGRSWYTHGADRALRAKRRADLR
jgi:hypothetical protein